VENLNEYEVATTPMEERISGLRQGLLSTQGTAEMRAAWLAELEELTGEVPVIYTQEVQEAAVSGQDVSAVTFVALAQGEYSMINDCTIARYAVLFPEWNKDWRGNRGAIVQLNGQLFRAIHPVQDAAQNKKPSRNSDLWQVIGGKIGDYMEWIPIIPGVNEPHNRGDRVVHNGALWESDVYGNVWEPGVFGWSVV